MRKLINLFDNFTGLCITIVILTVVTVLVAKALGIPEFQVGFWSGN